MGKIYDIRTVYIFFIFVALIILVTIVFNRLGDHGATAMTTLMPK